MNASFTKILRLDPELADKIKVVAIDMGISESMLIRKCLKVSLSLPYEIITEKSNKDKQGKTMDDDSEQNPTLIV